MEITVCSKCGGEMQWRFVSSYQPGEPPEPSYYKGTCLHCDNEAVNEDEPKELENGK